MAASIAVAPYSMTEQLSGTNAVAAADMHTYNQCLGAELLMGSITSAGCVCPAVHLRVTCGSLGSRGSASTVTTGDSCCGSSFGSQL